MQIRERKTEAVEAETPAGVQANVSPDAETNLAIQPSSICPPASLFESVGRTTFTERFPLLTCIVISCGLLAAALITEIECLKGSGYFWR